jgi:hypothetical protein
MTEQTHLLLADRLWAQLGWEEIQRGPMLLGAIGPDAYRVAAGVDYRDVHFRSRREPGRRLVDFLIRYLRPSLQDRQPEATAFYAGWLSHICGDMIWRQTVRTELNPLWERVTYGSRLEALALRQQFYDECALVDVLLYEDFTGQLDEIRWALQRAAIQHTVPPLQAYDLTRWRQQVLLDALPPSGLAVEEPLYVGMALVEQCLEAAQAETLSVLQWEISTVGRE